MPVSLPDGVFPPWMEGMALQEPNKGQPETVEHSVFANRFRGILRTAWIEATGRAIERRDYSAIALNKPNKKLFHVSTYSGAVGASATAMTAKPAPKLPVTAPVHPVSETRVSRDREPTQDMNIAPVRGTRASPDCVGPHCQTVSQR